MTRWQQFVTGMFVAGLVLAGLPASAYEPYEGVVVRDLDIDPLLVYVEESAAAFTADVVLEHEQKLRLRVEVYGGEHDATPVSREGRTQVFTVSGTVPQGQAPGEYPIQLEVWIDDGRRVVIREHNFDVWGLPHRTYVAADDEDLAFPTIEAMTVTPTSFVTGPDDQKVDINLEVSDADSGVAVVGVRVEEPDNTGWEQHNYFPDRGPEQQDSVADRHTVSAYATPGVYRILISLRDQRGYEIHLNAEDLEDLGLPSHFVVEGEEDTEPPVLVSGHMDGEAFAGTNGETVMPIHAELTDDLSGISSVSAFYCVAGFNDCPHDLRVTTHRSWDGNNLHVDWNGYLVFPEPGEYELVRVSAFDQAHNHVRFAQGNPGPFPTHVTIHPREVPATPAAPTVTQTSEDEVTAAWSDPAGGAPVLEWRLQREGEDEVSVFAPEVRSGSFAVVPGSVRFRIAARNAIGWSAWSDYSDELVIPEPVQPPGPPTEVRAEPGIELGQALVSWRPPLDDGGGTITHYVISRDGAALATVDGDARDYVDPDADPLTDRWYTVRAVNSAGEGPESTPVCSAGGPAPPLPELRTCGT